MMTLKCRLSTRSLIRLRDNRTSGADKVVTSAKDMKKKERASFDFVCDGTVFVVKWNDNSIVNVASNF